MWGGREGAGRGAGSRRRRGGEGVSKALSSRGRSMLGLGFRPPIRGGASGEWEGVWGAGALLQFAGATCATPLTGAGTRIQAQTPA
jgi:hypothetical protein